MVFIKQAMEPRCKLRHRKCRPNSKIQIKKKAIKENRREIRESLTVMVISSVHDHDKNYDHDVHDDIGNVDGTRGYTGSDDYIECCSQSAECGVKELAHHFTRGFR